MFDLAWIRENPDAFDQGLARRGVAPQAAGVLDLDQRCRAAQTALQGLQEKRKTLSKEIGLGKRDGTDTAALEGEVAGIKDAMTSREVAARELGESLTGLLAGLPNLPAEDVPDGTDEAANVEIRSFGKKPDFPFKTKEHFELGEALGQMDFTVAAKLSGARFVVLSGALARLERALAAFMLDLHTQEFGYLEVSPPCLVREEALFGTGQLPKFGEDLFHTTDGYWLLPTAEVALTNLVAGDIVDAEALPLRYVALTPCFRSEAGAAGKDTRGMIRQHQFNKVELVSIVHPDQSDAEHARMTAAAEEVLKRLELAYRVVTLSAGDIGFSARKTYDLEVWLPGQGCYREISSCSNCGDFQARRMKARFRSKGEKGTRFPHTLNGSGLAVGRTLVAVLENGQRADGGIDIPQILRPYLGGMKEIAPNV
ncbi:MAG: serine--tRNA ligase [Rhodospirillaceae bacterium]|nr:MAG: serine--tRNA ligase [Rhodospirillaceae bacterium]